MAEFKVEGMSCQHCVAAVTRAIHEIDAAAQVQVDLEHGRVVVASEVAPFGRTVFSIFKWNAGRSRCRFHRGQHREVSFIRGLVRKT